MGARPVSEALTAEWFDTVTAALASDDAGRIGEPDASAQIEIVVAGADPDPLRTRWVVEGGRLVSVRPATDGDAEADVSAPQSAEDLRAVVAGDLDPAVAFMRGDLKPEGSAAAWFAFVSAMNRPETRAALSG
jgi:putative sterol carrier protein